MPEMESQLVFFTRKTFLSFLQFFMLILLIFLAELAAAILAFIFREHVSCCSVHLHP